MKKTISVSFLFIQINRYAARIHHNVCFFNGFGAADISIKDVWLALSSSSVNEQISIIRDIRLPREIAAVFVGLLYQYQGLLCKV